MRKAIAATITLGILIGSQVARENPQYVTINFEDNHYEVEEQEPILEVEKVQAKEIEETPIESKIRAVFGEAANEAIIIAKCESGLDPSRIGDKALIVYNGDDIVGDSIGLFQIRTGGKDFNRARANGMTPDEFRQYLLDEDNNIKYAKEIYDRQGWGPWTCKKDL